MVVIRPHKYDINKKQILVNFTEKYKNCIPGLELDSLISLVFSSVRVRPKSLVVSSTESLVLSSAGMSVIYSAT